jgi:lipoprotein signal peptidase
LSKFKDVTTGKPFISLIIILVVSVVIDQWTKQWAHHTLLDAEFHQETDDYPVCGNLSETLKRERFVSNHRETIPVIDGFFNLRYVENCASAFGVMNRVPEAFRFPFFLIISVLALAFIPYLYAKTPSDQRLMLYGLPFILGGAIGNLIDRLVTRYVIDFIEWYIKIGGQDRHWPTFNIADAAIVIGIGLMILQMAPRRKKAAAPSGSKS